MVQHQVSVAASQCALQPVLRVQQSYYSVHSTAAFIAVCIAAARWYSYGAIARVYGNDNATLTLKEASLPFMETRLPFMESVLPFLAAALTRMATHRRP
eukprot:1185568-Rhodomonas_salina.2